jgi:hypothetical protein
MTVLMKKRSDLYSKAIGTLEDPPILEDPSSTNDAKNILEDPSSSISVKGLTTGTDHSKLKVNHVDSIGSLRIIIHHLNSFTVTRSHDGS